MSHINDISDEENSKTPNSPLQNNDLNSESGISAETISRVLNFRDARAWHQFHNPKDLAISISLEAAELLEIFQWSGSKTDLPEKLFLIEEELADVLNYSILMADVLGLNLNDILNKKIDHNEQKYNIKNSYGNSKKYTEWEEQ